MAKKPGEVASGQHFIDPGVEAKSPCPERWAESKPVDDQISFKLNGYFCLEVCVVMLYVTCYVVMLY